VRKHAASYYKRDVVMGMWKAIRAEYNSKDLTLSKDKLNAIAGIARQFQTILREPFVAGLWEGSLLQELLWVFDITGMIQISFKPPAETYQAPSWSWLSLNESVRNMATHLTRPLAEILDYKVNHVENSDFVQITSGYLRIRGRLARATIVDTYEKILSEGGFGAPERSIELLSSEGNLRIQPLFFRDSYRPVLVGKHTRYPLPDSLGGMTFYVLPLIHDYYKWAGLTLKSTGRKGEYQRSGVWSLERVTVRGVERTRSEWFNSYKPCLSESEYLELGDDGSCVLRIV